MPFPENLRERRSRTLVLILAVAGALLTLGGRLFFLQIMHGTRFAELARENMVRSEPIAALRGRFFDRNGCLLAGNRISFNLSLEAGHPAYKEPDTLTAAAREVGRLLGQDPEDIEARAKRYRNRFEPMLLDRDVDPTDLAPFVERLHPIPGITISEVPLRWYPRGTLAAHILGYMGEVGETELRHEEWGYRRGALMGRAGLERQYEPILRGADGETYVRVDALGRVTDLFPDLPPQPPSPGADLYLCLDVGLQAVAEEALGAAEAEPTSRRRRAGLPLKGSLVALDPWTGEILACVSTPGFDPAAFAHGLSSQEWAALNSEDKPLLNRVIQAGYPPGSIHKIITTLAGLDAGILSAYTRYEPCYGVYTFGNRNFRCWKSQGHGRVDLVGAFEQSCDVYYYQLARQMGLRRYLRYMSTLKMDGPTGVDLPDERDGLIPDLEWYRKRLGTAPPEGVALNLAIGQGEIILTPLQIVALVGALVSDGVVRRPHLARKAVLRDGTVTWQHDPHSGTRTLPVSAEQRRLVLRLLEQAVEGERGTGWRARVEGIRVGGKTGTAQNPHGDDHALFLAVAPASEPAVVVLAVLEESGHGGSVAAPVVQKVLEAYFRPDSLLLTAEPNQWRAPTAEVAQTAETTENFGIWPRGGPWHGGTP